MQKIVKPSVINGSVKAPASKSMMQRAIAAGILACGTTVLRNYSPCNDSDTALQIARDFGCIVSTSKSNVIIESTGGLRPSKLINCGEAGLGIRMFTPIAALSGQEIILGGEGSLKKRPVSMLEQPLRQLGVSIETNNGFVPIKVTGPLKGGHATVDGSLSSQMLTGLLLALPCASADSVLTVNNLTSKPYIEMTLEVMRSFGVQAFHDAFRTFRIKGNQVYRPTDFSVEGDWSGAAFLLVAGALGGSVTVQNLRIDSMQADTSILQALVAAGAEVRTIRNSAEVKKSLLNAFEFDATDCPDLFPPLVALAAHCTGDSRITGVTRLKYKESDRALILKQEYAKAGTEIILQDDVMIVKGGTFKGGQIHANNDHRIAMSAAVAGIAAKEPVVIENSECIAKSYPGFYDDLASIGVSFAF